MASVRHFLTPSLALGERAIVIVLTVVVVPTPYGGGPYRVAGLDAYFADQVESVGLWRQQQRYIRAVTCCKNKMSD